jgi:Protein of unknown function (DUF3352)
LRQLNATGFAFTYINPAEISSLITKKENVVSWLKTQPNLALGFNTDKLGIKAEAVLAVDATLNNPAPAADLEILKYIPKGSSLVVGSNLAQILNICKGGGFVLNASNAAKDAPNPLDGILDTKSFDWITDQYAIALTPQTDQKTHQTDKSDTVFNPAFNWLLIAKNAPNAQNLTAITKLDQNARQANLTVGEINTNNQNITLWAKLNPIADNVTGKVSLVHATNEKYVLFSNSVQTLQTALALPSILDNDLKFKAIASAIGTKNGLVYVNAENLHNFPTLNPTLRFIQNQLQSLAIGKITTLEPNSGDLAANTPNFLHSQLIFNWTKSKS